MYSEKEKKWYIEREQLDAKGCIKIIKRDFYDDLPRAVCEILDNISWRWRNYDWFEEAWNKYREHVINASAGGLAIKAPGFVFNSYIDEQVKEDFLNNEQSEVLHSELNIDELIHTQYRKRQGVPGGGQFTTEDDPDGEAIPGTEASTNKSSTDNSPNKDDVIEKMRKENDEFNVVKKNYEAQNWAKELKNQKEKDAYNNAKNIAGEGRNIALNIADIAQERRGTKRVNDKDYSNISDEEMRKRVNRMSLERQYGDLTGDTKYVMTGREKVREYMQTAAGALGIIGSIVAIALSIKNLKNG